MNRFFKIFLISAMLTWPFTALYFYAEWGLYRGTALGFVCALIAGLTVAHIVDDFLFLRRKKETHRKRISPHQTESAILELSEQHAFDQCISAIKSIGAKIKHRDEKSGKICAVTGITWKSFGEVITVDVVCQKDQKVLVKVNSKPVVPLTLSDHGKGQENVKCIISLIQSRH